MIEQQQVSSRQSPNKRVRIYHPSLWAKYKGAVYSSLYRLSQNSGIEVSFVQISETHAQRVSLGGVDLSYHQYPYRLLFRGNYDDASAVRRAAALTFDLMQHQTDLVVLPGYDRIENWVMLMVCIVLGRKRAVTCDSTIFDRPQVLWRSWAKRFFFARCDGLIGYGQRTKEYLMSLGVPEADIIIPCQAAALPHDYDSSEVLSFYERHSRETPVPARFLYLGRLSPEKGLRDLISAFSLVRSVMPGAHLDIIGAGPMQAELVEQSAAHGLNEAVTFHGPRDLADIVPLFFRSVALVLPSHSEPWGLVVNESLSFGCPVVVSDRCGCVPELVIDGVTGFSFETGDAGALSKAMLAVAGLSKDRLGTATQCIRVVSAFTPDRAASRMLEGCIQFLAKRR